MSFGLKNVGATYQRMITRIFKEKIGNIVEIYIDDMVVKSKANQRHVGDLIEIFEVLRWYRLRLNVDKCVFDVGAGKFLRYMITH